MNGRPSRLINLSGLRFGRLTVIEYAGEYRPKNDPEERVTDRLWRCRCDCGQESIVIGGNLKTGRTRSCGCLQKQLLKERYAAAK